MRERVFAEVALEREWERRRSRTRMTTTFNKEKHEYLIDGKRATGVTTIIGVLAKPQLISWASRMACEHIRENADKHFLPVPGGEQPSFSYYEVSEELLGNAQKAHTRKKEVAGEKGTDMHSLVEGYVRLMIADQGGKPFLMNNPQTAIEPFIKWAVENVKEFLFSERQMFNKDLFIAGTADFSYIGKDEKKYMADFKTSSGIYGIDYWLQVAAYRMLAEAEGDQPYEGATIVRMGKDGSFDVQHLYEYETYKEAFLSCLTLYRAQAAIKGLIVNN